MTSVPKRLPATGSWRAGELRSSGVALGRGGGTSGKQAPPAGHVQSCLGLGSGSLEEPASGTVSRCSQQ